MSQLSANALIPFEVLGETNSVPVATGVTIYKGSAVGSLAGYGRQLVAGDIFLGFAEEYALGGAADGTVVIGVRPRGVAYLAVASVAVTDIGKPVYASDGATFTLTQSTNTRIGTVVRFVATGYAMVAFDATAANALDSVTALTDSTTGTAAATLAAGAGVHTVVLPINLVAIAADGDVVTTFTPGYKFKILSAAFAVTTKATTGAKATTLNLEIGTTNVTGGEIALTSSNCGTLGAVVAGTAITAANTGAANATISVEAASTTAFSEGAGGLILAIQNMDTADAIASLASKLAEVIAAAK